MAEKFTSINITISSEDVEKWDAIKNKTQIVNKLVKYHLNDSIVKLDLDENILKKFNDDPYSELMVKKLITSYYSDNILFIDEYKKMIEINNTLFGSNLETPRTFVSHNNISEKEVIKANEVSVTKEISEEESYVDEDTGSKEEEIKEEYIHNKEEDIEEKIEENKIIDEEENTEEDIDNIEEEIPLSKKYSNNNARNILFKKK